MADPAWVPDMRASRSYRPPCQNLKSLQEYIQTNNFAGPVENDVLAQAYQAWS